MTPSKWIVSAKVMVAAHTLLTFAWFAAMIVLVFLPKHIQTSVLLVLIISCYANFVGHFSAFQAALSDLRSPDE